MRLFNRFKNQNAGTKLLCRNSPNAPVAVGCDLHVERKMAKVDLMPNYCAFTPLMQAFRCWPPFSCSLSPSLFYFYVLNSLAC